MYTNTINHKEPKEESGSEVPTPLFLLPKYYWNLEFGFGILTLVLRFGGEKDKATVALLSVHAVVVVPLPNSDIRYQPLISLPYKNTNTNPPRFALI
jgi:hypothetical protein